MRSGPLSPARARRLRARPVPRLAASVCERFTLNTRSWTFQGPTDSPNPILSPAIQPPSIPMGAAASSGSSDTTAVTRTATPTPARFAFQ